MTFRPLHETRCEQPIVNFYYTEDGQDNALLFTLHPSDHIRLHQTALINSIIYTIPVSIGTSFVFTGGLTAAIPVYFTDNFLAEAYIYSSSQISPLEFELDMTKAEFHMWFGAPVTSNHSQIMLSCEDQTVTTVVEGLWSSPVPVGSNATRLSMKLSPLSFAAICRTLPCIRDNSAILLHVSSLSDVFGTNISSGDFQNNIVRQHQCQFLSVLVVCCRYQWWGLAAVGWGLMDKTRWVRTSPWENQQYLVRLAPSHLTLS